MTWVCNCGHDECCESFGDEPNHAADLAEQHNSTTKDCLKLFVVLCMMRCAYFTKAPYVGSQAHWTLYLSLAALSLENPVCDGNWLFEFGRAGRLRLAIIGGSF